MRNFSVTIAGIAYLTATSTASPAYREVTLLDKQQAACFFDVMRLCRDFVPDVEATKECMRTKKKQVSSGCAAYYPATN